MSIHCCGADAVHFPKGDWPGGIWVRDYLDMNWRLGNGGWGRIFDGVE